MGDAAALVQWLTQIHACRETHDPTDHLAEMPAEYELVSGEPYRAQPAPDVAGLPVDEALLSDLVRGPYLDSLMEDLRAGRTDAEHVARWLMGDLRALVAARSTSEDSQ